MSTEPRSTFGVDTPIGPRDVELVPHGLIGSTGARIGLLGSPDGVSEIHVAFGQRFTAGDQLFHLDGLAPNPEPPDPERAGGHGPYRLAVSWLGDAPPGTEPAEITEFTVLVRTLPLRTSCGFTIVAATAHGEFGTEGQAAIAVHEPQPRERAVPFGDTFTARDQAWHVDGWLVLDPQTSTDTPMLRVRRTDA